MHHDEKTKHPIQQWQTLPDDILITAILPRIASANPKGQNLRAFAQHCKTGRRLVTVYARHLFLNPPLQSQRFTCEAIDALEKDFFSIEHIRELSVLLKIVITPDLHPAFGQLAAHYFARSVMGVNELYCRNMYRLHIMTHQPLETLRNKLSITWNSGWEAELLALANEHNNQEAITFIQQRKYPQLKSIEVETPSMAHG